MHFVLIILRSCSQTVGCNWTPIIGHFRKPIIYEHPAKSTNRDIINTITDYSNNNLSSKARDFPKWRNKLMSLIEMF